MGSTSDATARNTANQQHLALRFERLCLLVEARSQPLQSHEEALAVNRDARARLLAARNAAGESIPFLSLIECFGLSMFELDVLELAVGMRLDYRLRAVVTNAIPAVRDEGLTIGSAVALLSSSGEARIDLARELSRSSLWDRGLLRHADREFIDARLVPTRRAIAAVLGEGPLDWLPPWAYWQGVPRAQVYEIEPARAAASVERGGLIIVSGATGTGKTEVAHAIANGWNARSLAINVARCSEAVSVRDLVPTLVEVIEDAGIVGVPVVLDPVRRALAGITCAERLADACERAEVRAVLCADSLDDLPVHLVDRALLRISLRGVRGELAANIFKAHADHSQTAWLPDEALLRPRQIRHAAALSQALAIPPDAAIHAAQRDSSDLLEATRTQLRLDDLVVAPEVHEELLELIGAIRGRSAVLHEWGVGRRMSRGRGVSALFDGEPGTGKTMAAEVVAHEVGLPLRRVNIATVVDKYIGETEKNLQRLFVEARNSSCILLFDEADSLFGARTDVKGSNDRYANLEVNVLLQLMEEHGGVVVLTTNLKKNVDQAFLRRLGYKVHFELPDERLRSRIWSGMLPMAQCEQTVDVAKLARTFPLAGGDIKSAVMRAAYRAASIQRKISMSDLVECAELECQAQGRVVTFRSV